MSLQLFWLLKERLDFAMKEIIYDLLCVSKSHKTFTINPEVEQKHDLNDGGLYSMSYLSTSPCAGSDRG